MSQAYKNGFLNIILKKSLLIQFEFIKNQKLLCNLSIHMNIKVYNILMVNKMRNKEIFIK